MPDLKIELQLVESLQKGDPEAFEALFIKYSKRLFAFSNKYLRSKELSEELVQSVFLKVWENRFRINKESSFQSFLFTIAYNDICNQFKKIQNEKKYVEKLSSELSPMFNIDQRIDYQSVLEQVNSLIQQLPEIQRQVFLKSRRDGLSSKEIAKELRIAPGTVDNYISASLKFLKSHIAKDNLPLLLFFSLLIF